MSSAFTFKRNGSIFGQPAYDVYDEDGLLLGRIAGISGLWHVEGDTTKFNTRHDCVLFGLLSRRGAR